MPALEEKILLVEDDADLVELLAELLRHEGYQVVSMRTTEDGLAALREQTFSLVLTDHRMPGRTGAEMLAEATEAGLLRATGVLVLTADHEDPALAPWRVLRKPIDFDVLLDEIHRAIVEATGGPPRPAGEGRREAAMQQQIELVLYVTSASPASVRAQRNLERALAGYDAAKISLVVVDLSQPGAESAASDRVAFTPTLVKRAPAPRTWLLGDLRDLKALRQLLEDAGVARKAP